MDKSGAASPDYEKKKCHSSTDRDLVSPLFTGSCRKTTQYQLPVETDVLLSPSHVWKGTKKVIHETVSEARGVAISLGAVSVKFQCPMIDHE